MYHSLIFFEDFEEYSETSSIDETVYVGTTLKNPINTWDDWHIVPSERPVINPPNVRTNEVVIPGRSGSLDLSEVLTGYPLYDNRTGSIEFMVMNPYTRPDENLGVVGSDWQHLYSRIMRTLHGKTFKMMLEDDPAHYYEGRFSVNSWKSDKNWSTITIDYNVQPYKLDRQSVGEDWLWDSFCFEDGVVYDTTDELNSTISLDTNNRATLAYDQLRYYPGSEVPAIESDSAKSVIYGKDNHAIPTIRISDLDTQLDLSREIRLPCIISIVAHSGRTMLCDALYKFYPIVRSTIDLYDTVDDYDNETEPSRSYIVEFTQSGVYQEASWAIPPGGVAVICSTVSWRWTRNNATFSNNINEEPDIRDGGLYTSAKYDPANNPVWLSLVEPYSSPYELNTYEIGVQYTSYSNYVTDKIGSDHIFEATAKVTVDYRGGVL